MKYSGTALCVGDHIDTDAIIPARFLITTDTSELASHCMEGYELHWVEKVKPGATVLVAGRNFGCGSSREHAPLAIVGAGIPVVLAHSFARIFYRNAFNMGLIPLEIGDAYTQIKEGDEIEITVDAGRAVNKTTGKEITFAPLPKAMENILNSGGLAQHVKKRMTE